MKPILLLFVAGSLAASCHQPVSAPAAPRRDDSAQIVKLLKEVYRWHEHNQASQSDYVLIVKDSFQVGVNNDSLQRRLDTLKQTGFFSPTFLDNYKRLAHWVDDSLKRANPKLYNEINFSFQDADPWTGFQDAAPNYWDSFKISNYQPAADSVSLKWQVEGTDPYAVRFSFGEGKWQIAYLQGFDLKGF